LFSKGQGKVFAAAGGTALIGAFVGDKFNQSNQNTPAIQSLYQQQKIRYGGLPAPVIYQLPNTAPAYQ
jgi:hypothetical protein